MNEKQLQEFRDLYQEKNNLLKKYLVPVTEFEFYREVFPEGSFERQGIYEDHKGNGIAIEIFSTGKVRRFTVTDGLEQLDKLHQMDFVIMSPISYFGNSRCGKNARYLYAMAFDLDGVGMPQLKDTLHQMNHAILPKATFVVNSGTGLHLYYLLDNPVPMYPQNQLYLKELKYSLTRQIWNRFTSTIEQPQMQGIMQGFRMVGSGSKLGRDYQVMAYRFGNRVSLDDLIEFVPDSNGEQQRIKGIMQQSNITLEEAQEKYPEWYERRILRKERRNHWKIKRDLYDWWLHRIHDEIKVGHRFYGIMTLAIYARKCCIDEDELRSDAYSLLQVYDEMSTDELNRFTEEDIICALEMYNEDYVTFPRDDIGKLAGIPMPVNKRNGRKQAVHLMGARAIQEINDKVNGTNWRNENGRPKGSGTAQKKVQDWRFDHPEGRKIDCERETGLSRHTVLKWWNS